jgi:hypothetical protein
MEVNMSAIDLFRQPGQPGVDPERQRALLIGWLLLTTNTLLCSVQTRIVKTDEDRARVTEEGKRPNSWLNFIDLRDIYPALAPLTEEEVDDLFQIARSSSEFHVVASSFWNAGESLLHYSDHYCLAVEDVLSVGRG